MPDLVVLWFLASLVIFRFKFYLLEVTYDLSLNKKLDLNL
jgi:hypothetical protein